jgi:NTE family protein
MTDTGDRYRVPARMALPPITLVLSGGNALGAFQAGAAEALEDAGAQLVRVAGASVGAINGALIAGNAPGDRVGRLRTFWQPATTRTPWWWEEAADTARRTAAVGWTMLAGQPSVFVPKLAPLPDPAPALYDTRPLDATLRALVDFDRLNAGDPRYVATAVDLDSGEDVVMDATRTRIGPEHIRASAALMPVFPPVEVEGRALVDPGLSANLPLDAVLDEPDGSLVIALDLLPLAAPRPVTAGETVARMQDFVFAAQSRRSLEMWRRIYALGDTRATVIHLPYQAQEREVVGKAFDFSPESVRARWDTGRAAMAHVLDRVAAGAIRLDGPGLTWVRAERDG